MKKIFLKVLCISLLFIETYIYAQVNVSGKITDTSGEPLIGATIVVDGTVTGTISDIDGNYKLTVPNTDAILVFKYVGYIEQLVTVGNQSVIDITMLEDAKRLEEVVVSALGFEQNKDELGSTFATIQATDAQRSGEVGFASSLAAKASNVIINNSTGDPGASTTIRIRGANSIQGNTSPLIILDGVPISNETIYGGGNTITGSRQGGTVQQSRLNDLNPDDIASVTVLKGASAASLWGSRAANGVIVITTKDGAAGKIKISYKNTTSFDNVHERIKMQNTYGQGRDGSYSATAAESWGNYIPDRSGAADEVDKSGGFFTAKDGTVYYPITAKNSRTTYVEENWNSVFQTGGYTQHDLSVSGGKEEATFFLSFGRLDQEGIIRNSDYNRTNLRLNSKFVLADWLTASARTGYVNSNSNRIQQSSNTAGLLLGLLRTPPDFDQRDYIGNYTDGNGQIFTNRHRSYRRYLGNQANPTYNNPLWTIFEQVANSKIDRFTMAGEFNIIPTNWLQFIIRGGVDSYVDTRSYFFPVNSAGDRNPGIFAEDNIKERELNFDFIGKANFDIVDQVSLQTTFGFNINDRNRNIVNAQITGFLANVRKETADLNSNAASSTFNNTRRFIRSNRGYAVLGFDILDQINLNLSGAIEAASSIKGSFFYPSVDVAWRLNNFLDLSNAPLSFAKLRASWGRVGVQPLPHRFETTAEGAFTYTTYSSTLDIALHEGGFRLNDDLGNPNLKPEIKTEWEIGTDLRFLNDKLTFTITYYQNEIRDILIEVGLTPSSGFDTQYANAATMENKGLEFDWNYAVINSEDWSVNTFMNWSRNKNTVTDLAGTETIDLSGASISSRAIVGQPLGVFFGTGSQTNEDGSFILNDNGFPQLTSSPIVLGDPNPDWRTGFGFNVSWKDLSLNVLFEHSHGGDFSPRTQWVLRRFGTTQETANTFTTTQDLKNYDGETIPSGTKVRGNIEDFGGGPVLLDETWYRHGIGGGFGDNQAYNFAIKSAQYTRLRELSLSYVLNSSGFKNATKLSSVIFTLTGRNLFLWDSLQGVDPQVNQTGVGNAAGLDYFTNPSTRSFLFSVGINF